MLINLTNHPLSIWDKKQIKTANKLYGKIQDLPFPAISPDADEKRVYALTIEYAKNVKKIISQSTDTNNAVHIMGELTFTFNLVQLLKTENIQCIASTSKRNVVQTENKKQTEFNFVKFRDY